MGVHVLSSPHVESRIIPEFIEPALNFLANPWNVCENGGFALKRTVLKLAYAEPLRYSRETGYRIAEITLPFKALAGINGE